MSDKYACPTCGGNIALCDCWPGNYRIGNYPGERIAIGKSDNEALRVSARECACKLQGGAPHQYVPMIERDAYDRLRDIARANALIFDKCNAERKALKRDYADCHADLQAVAKDCDEARACLRFEQDAKQAYRDMMEHYREAIEAAHAESSWPLVKQILYETLLPKVGESQPKLEHEQTRDVSADDELGIAYTRAKAIE